MATQTIELKTAQTKYFKALLVEQKLRVEVTELNNPLNEAVERNQISDEEWAEKVTHNEFATGLNTAQNQRIEAENNLIHVARGIIFNIVTPEQWAEMQVVWDCKRLNVREKVIGLLPTVEGLVMSEWTEQDEATYRPLRNKLLRIQAKTRRDKTRKRRYSPHKKYQLNLTQESRSKQE